MNNFLFFDSLPSTNSYAKEHIHELSDHSLIFAAKQTSGRGRQGKEWIAPEGNLSMSLVYKNQSGDVSLYPLFCALAVCRTLFRLTGKNPQIKWPNDILFEKKKICGILCESIIFSSQIHIICGIGINVNTDENGFQKAELPYAASLKMLFGREFSLTEIAKVISQEMDSVLKEFNLHGFSNLKQDYEHQLFNKGRHVQVIYQQKTISATCLGIADNGNLLCDCDGEIISVNSGEASVRGLYGYL